ncbi:Cof-type HAD-IIB family hydrolase [Paenibacillus sp. 1P03SA]|uniref:Cof-type HAD-IIB family hydrolase n=1 Tax=Paenibacillus sp. 1P03SA TaxID=3132294 RepID=UPI0039A16CED
MIKLIVTDLDGTLMNADLEVAEPDARMLREAAGQGVQICIASGRLYPDIRKIMDRVGVGAYGISQNGSAVYTREGEQLHASHFPADRASDLFEIVSKRELVFFVCCSDETIRLHRSTDASRPYEERQLSPVHLQPDIGEEIRSGQVKPCKLSLFGDMEKLLSFREELMQKYEGSVEAVISDHDCMDLMPAGVSKGTGLALLLKELGLRHEEAACIGDSFNDLPMFALTPHSFAMIKSRDEVKAGAGHTTSSVAEAVTAVLEHNHGGVGRKAAGAKA